MYGQKEVASPKYPEALLINSEIDKPRKKRFQRFKPGPAAVHKVFTYSLYPHPATILLLLEGNMY
jgi:hypothetical protein